MPNLTGKVCLVTGASRGIGKGIAVQLVTYGATCYITGRNEESLRLVTDEAKSREGNGVCIPVKCDHSDVKDVEGLFTKIAEEQGGRLDLLVNNAYSAVTHIMEKSKYYFWDIDPKSWDTVNNVGLRNHFYCAVFASRLMVPRRSGLIVNVSSEGGKAYFQLPQYGVGKEGKDRMARDCGIELANFNVAFVSLWPGPVKTELIEEKLKVVEQLRDLEDRHRLLKKVFGSAETPEFSGKCIAYLLADKDIMKRSGEILLTSDLSEEFRFKDIDGTSPVNRRSVQRFLLDTPLAAVASYLPTWFKIPKFLFMMMLSSYKPKIRKEQSAYE